MTFATVKKIGVALATLAVAGLILGLLFLAVVRFWPRRDPLPAQLARQDEKVATRTATAIGADVDRQTADATLHIDLTTKDIRDAFDSLPPPMPAPAAGAEPRPLPAAPVDRVRDRLNESIARANRAAGDATAPGGAGAD